MHGFRVAPPFDRFLREPKQQLLAHLRSRGRGHATAQTVHKLELHIVDRLLERIEHAVRTLLRVSLARRIGSMLEDSNLACKFQCMPCCVAVPAGCVAVWLGGKYQPDSVRMAHSGR